MSLVVDGPVEPESTVPRRLLKVAVTDVYDEGAKRTLVDYPRKVLVWLTIAGVAAFVATGLLGYQRHDLVIPNHEAPWDALALILKIASQKSPGEAVVFIQDSILFHKPWPLFLFFCALIITLQWSVLRARALAAHRRLAITYTVASMMLVTVVYFFHNEFGDILTWIIQHLPTPGGQIKEALVNPWTYLVINVVLLGVIFGQGVAHWLRAPGKLSNPPIDLSSGLPLPVSDEEANAGKGENFVGDIILRAFLMGWLTLAFWFPIISLPARIFGVHVDYNNITDSSVFSVCSATLPGAPGTTCRVGFAFEIWFLDVAIAVLALAAGIIGLAFLMQDESMRVIGTEGSAERQGTMGRGQAILYTFLDIVLSPFNRAPRTRIGRRVTRDIQGSLRTLALPCLILLAVASAGELALAVQQTLHAQKFYGVPQGGDPIDPWMNGLAILEWSLLVVLGTVLALGTQLGRWRVIANTVRFLRSVAFSNALPIVLLTLALALVNGVVLFLAHLVDLTIHQQTQQQLWQDSLGLDASVRLRPFYPGVIVIALNSIVWGFYIIVLLWSRFRARPQQPMNVAK